AGSLGRRRRLNSAAGPAQVETDAAFRGQGRQLVGGGPVGLVQRVAGVQLQVPVTADREPVVEVDQVHRVALDFLEARALHAGAVLVDQAQRARAQRVARVEGEGDRRGAVKRIA